MNTEKSPEAELDLFLKKCLELGRTPEYDDLSDKEKSLCSHPDNAWIMGKFTFDMGLVRLFGHIYCSYALDINPLPSLRSKFEDWEWIYINPFSENVASYKPNFVFEAGTGFVIARKTGVSHTIFCGSSEKPVSKTLYPNSFVAQFVIEQLPLDCHFYGVPVIYGLGE